MIFVITKCCNTFFALRFGFVLSLLCRGDCFVHKFCTFSCVEDWLVSFVKFLSGYSRNPSRGEGGDVEFGTQTLKHILVFAFGYLSLNSTLFISRIAIIVHLFMLDIVCVLTLVLNQESY